MFGNKLRVLTLRRPYLLPYRCKWSLYCSLMSPVSRCQVSITVNHPECFIVIVVVVRVHFCCWDDFCMLLCHAAVQWRDRRCFYLSKNHFCNYSRPRIGCISFSASIEFLLIDISSVRVFVITRVCIWQRCLIFLHAVYGCWSFSCFAFWCPVFMCIIAINNDVD